MINKTQKALLTAAGYEFLEELNFIKEIENNAPNVCVFYDGSKFIIHICHCNLITPEDQENFDKEFSIKYSLVKALNSAGGVE